MVRSYAIFLFFMFFGCQTLWKSKENKISCYCGRLESPQGRTICALWSKVPRTEENPKQPIATMITNSCDPDACVSFAKRQGSCQRITFWKPTKFKESKNKDPCYCDFIELGGQSKYCAIWRNGDTFVREYHRSQICNIQICSSTLFRLRQSYCDNKFQNYYTPISKLIRRH